MNQDKQIGKIGADSVHKLLREAFPGCIQRPDLNSPTHSECVALRSRLISISMLDLPFYLREILEDLLDTHTSVSGNSEDAEAVIQYLNLSKCEIQAKPAGIPYGVRDLEKYLSDQEYLLQAKVKDFALFNKKQAYAIFCWLLIARTWDDLRWYVGDIDKAIEYWRTRAETIDLK